MAHLNAVGSRDSYTVTVEPGVDAAFILTLGMLIDDIKGTRVLY